MDVFPSEPDSVWEQVTEEGSQALSGCCRRRGVSVVGNIQKGAGGENKSPLKQVQGAQPARYG